MASLVERMSVHKLVKAGKRMKHQTCLSAFKNGLFELDLYAFTPSLITAQFSTWVSLLVSIMVSSLFIFSVSYSTYLWCVLDFTVSQGESAHNNGSFLVAPSLAGRGNMALPQAGVMLMMNDGSVPTDNSTVRHLWQQNIICSGGASKKLTDTMPSKLCSFYSTEDGTLRTNTTMCADWEGAVGSLTALNRTSTDACGISDGDLYLVPRIAGTFYNPEYGYITSTTSINATLLRNSSFVTNLYKGSVQLYLTFPYTGSSSLAAGKWPDGQMVVWSRRVNLLANSTMKWEVSLRVRQVVAASFFWDIPQLQQQALDYTVEFSEVSIASSSPGSDGYQEVAKVFLKLDDRDMQVTMTPYATVFSLFSDWGGFLSMLMAMGIPAMLYNQTIFRRTVEQLMLRGDIAFDEELRKKRSQAIATSFAVGKQHKDIQARRQSIIRLANAYDRQGHDHMECSMTNQGSITQVIQGSGNSTTTKRRVRVADGSILTMREGLSTAGSLEPRSPPILKPTGPLGSALKAQSPEPLIAMRSQAVGLIGTAPQPAPQQAGAVLLPPGQTAEVTAPATAWVSRQGSGDQGKGPEDETLSGEGAGAGAGPAGVPGPVPHPNAMPDAALDVQGGGEGSVRGSGASSARRAAVLAPVPDERSSMVKLGSEELHTAWGPSVFASTAAQEVLPPPLPQPYARGPQQPPPQGGPQPVAESLSPFEAQPPRQPPQVGTISNAPTESGQAQPRSSPGSQHGQLGVQATMSTSGGGRPPLPKSMSRQGSEPNGSGHTALVRLRHNNASIVSRPEDDEAEDDDDERSHYEAPQATGTASILVKYHQDIFEDSDEEENDFDDVVRHCTSECHALYHLRQVVKLVQHERSFLTCGTERYKLADSEPHGNQVAPVNVMSVTSNRNSVIEQFASKPDGMRQAQSSTGGILREA